MSKADYPPGTVLNFPGAPWQVEPSEPNAIYDVTITVTVEAESKEDAAHTVANHASQIGDVFGITVNFVEEA